MRHIVAGRKCELLKERGEKGPWGGTKAQQFNCKGIGTYIQPSLESRYERMGLPTEDVGTK